MRLMGRFARKLVPPVVPYFGSGEARLQPVSVKDVAAAMVAVLSRREAIGRIYEAGGPDVYTWKSFYAACLRLIPGARRWKPIVGLPVPLAVLLARTIMKTPLVPDALRFNVDQVVMAQEDSVCDPAAFRDLLGGRLRRFEEELATYGELIG